MKKIRAGVLGATGMVGQRFISLLENHPWFEVSAVAASGRSAGKSYREAVEGRWKLAASMPASVENLVVQNVEDVETIGKEVDFVFSAIDMEKEQIRALEQSYAAAGIPVVSNNSAHRWTPDVPMILPEVNPYHVDIIPSQQKARGWKKGFIAVKPNCSVQSYVPVLEALKSLEPERVIVTTLQAISGAGKTFESWPEMLDNVIPFIGGEEEKSEKEPMKIWGDIKEGAFTPATSPVISASCIRVPASDGHMASVSVAFRKKASKEEIIHAIRNFKNPLKDLGLPSAPEPFLTYFEEENRPQTGLDRELENGMGISVGRLREDVVLDWKFVALSHNTIRGAAGGAILLAELLKSRGFL